MHMLVVHLLCAKTSSARLATKYTPKLKDAYVMYLPAKRQAFKTL